MNKAIIRIQNLKCGGCEASIVSGLTKIEGIAEVEIHHADSSVHFTYSTLQTLEAARTKLRRMGYPPLEENNSLAKKAQSYVSCLIGKTK